VRERAGNRIWTTTDDRPPAAATTVSARPGADAFERPGTWGRIEGSTQSLDAAVTTSQTGLDIDLWRMQAGVDGTVLEASDGSRLAAGMTGHYGSASADIASVFGDGDIRTSGYGLGGTRTWYGLGGFYVDAQAQATWFDGDISSDTLGVSETSGNDGFGYALGLEAGKAIDIAPQWVVTPQAQLVYSAVDFDDFTDAFGARVTHGESDSLVARLGLAIDHETHWQAPAGDGRSLRAYAIANLYYEFLDGTAVGISGLDFSGRQDRLWGGVGAGASYSWGDGAYSRYGEAEVAAAWKISATAMPSTGRSVSA
jgi:fibronectin-binding autotransporter adhesin